MNSGTRPHVTCGVCGRVHVLERITTRAVTFPLVCHECESPLTVAVTAEALAHGLLIRGTRAQTPH